MSIGNQKYIEKVIKNLLFMEQQIPQSYRFIDNLR